ncbi:MAG TPA: ATP-binding cassette domain-containing protein, partial [Thermoplasmataceae archaeon]|nr:ATP-binding cassette domain-containing protein [Thermoplasmataceae archaeon]
MSEREYRSGGLILRVSNLYVEERGRPILEDINFSVERGTTLAIVGPNGAGKTTLFRVLMNLIPYTGTVEWSGRARIGYVPQTLVSTDLPVSVEEFLGLKSISDHKECMESVGLNQGM